MNHDRRKFYTKPLHSDEVIVLLSAKAFEYRPMNLDEMKAGIGEEIVGI